MAMRTNSEASRRQVMEAYWRAVYEESWKRLNKRLEAEAEERRAKAVKQCA